MANENDNQFDNMDFEEKEEQEQDSYNYDNELENQDLLQEDEPVSKYSLDEYSQDENFLENDSEPEDEEENGEEDNEESDTSEEDEYEEDDSEEDDEYEDDEEDNDNTNAVTNNKASMTIILGLIILLAIVGVFLGVKLVQNNLAQSQNESTVQEPAVSVADNKDAQQDITNAFFEDNSGNESNDMLSVNFNDNGDASVGNNTMQGDSVATVSNTEQSDVIFDSGFGDVSKNAVSQGTGTSSNNQEQKGNQDDTVDKLADSAAGNANNSIVVSWNKARQNPFKPPVFQQTKEDKYEKFGDVQFEIIEPPTELNPDANLTRLLQTQISGILYDNESPSAIVNLGGTDQFVKIGDEISGYKIKNITRNKVEISYKNNTYVASVGELFVPGRLEAQSAVANLNNKFAGRYKN